VSRLGEVAYQRSANRPSRLTMGVIQFHCDIRIWLSGDVADAYC